MTAQNTTILEEADIPLCDACVNDAKLFTEAVMSAWQESGHADEIFCFVVIIMADLIRFEEARNPEKLDAEYRRYIGRKLQLIGATIAGDVN
jgi:hypothetical protein